MGSPDFDGPPPPPFPASASLYKPSYTPPGLATDVPPSALPGALLVDADKSVSTHLELLLRPKLLSGAMHKHLWWAGLPGNIRPLQRQLHLQREFIATDKAGMHLVWTGNTLFLTPLPACLLSHSFWAAEISGNTTLDKSARGLLMSWTKLVQSETDFRIARDKGLLPECVLGWEQWADFVWVVRAGGGVDPDRCDRRYVYGELRLGRLNQVRRFCVDMQAYRSGYATYEEFFGKRFAWLALVVVLLGVVLSALQVMVGMEKPGGQIVIDIGWWFSVVCLLGVVIVVGGGGLLFSLMFMWNVVRTIKRQRKMGVVSLVSKGKKKDEETGRKY